MFDSRVRLEEILLAAVAAVDPAQLVADHLRSRLSLPEHRNLVVLAVGKAAAGMVRGVMQTLGGDIRGLAVCPEPTELPGFEVIVGEHPIPGPGSFDGGRRLMGAAAAAGHQDLVLVLLSGGASAMAEVPAPGVTEREIQDATSDLLRSGRPIGEINDRRTSWSALKGGGLTAAARPARMVTVAISDVGAAGPEAIGSGPSVGSDVFDVVADGATAARAAVRACLDAGLHPEMLIDPVTGHAADAGRRLGRSARGLATGSALVGFGETTVHMVGAGHGGRNQELSLAAAIEIAGTSALVGSIGTDGIDGPTSSAGAIVDGTTIERGTALGLDAAANLATHDSATFLEAVEDVIVTGPTGTNVGDVVVAIKPAVRPAGG